MEKIVDFPGDILKRNLVVQHSCLMDVQLRHSQDLVDYGFAKRFFTDLSERHKETFAGTTFIKPTYYQDSQKEDFLISFYKPASWHGGGTAVSDLVVTRANGQLQPSELYADLPYDIIVGQCDELHSLIDDGTLSSVDRYNFEVNWW